MKKTSFYDEAHVFLAAIRLFDFKNNAIPTHADISNLTGMSMDRVSHIASKLRDLGVIEMVEGAFEKTGFMISDHLKVEELPRETPKISLADELTRFKEKSKSALEDKVKAFTEEKKKKEQQLFDDLQKKFQEELKKK
ncbi:MAG: helix-turn-helix domain-containing protein [Proteobacteria bacterium]|nr:helix-turn-helix domain-containing protein [Pseudomonadota bacterium]